MKSTEKDATSTSDWVSCDIPDAGVEGEGRCLITPLLGGRCGWSCSPCLCREKPCRVVVWTKNDLAPKFQSENRCYLFGGGFDIISGVKDKEECYVFW